MRPDCIHLNSNNNGVIVIVSVIVSVSQVLPYYNTSYWIMSYTQLFCLPLRMCWTLIR